MSDLTDLKDYLEDAGQWDDVQLQAALDAEDAAQRARCRVPDVRPADLKQAWFRRVSRNLAMRKAPLGLQVGEVETTRVGSQDPEVRRIEGPYRRVVIG